MADSRINWKRGDFISLGRAVAQFNKKINELNREEKKLYLPETINYKEAKENITTRKELNRLINSLRRFQKQGAEDLYKTGAGEEISKWERKELGIQSRIAQTRLKAELKKLNVPQENGFSRVQMGSIRAREIEAQIKNLKQIETKAGYEFNMLKRRIASQGASDYTMKKAIVFRENYLNEMKKYSHFDNYDKLMNKLQSLTNPISFFNFVSQNELAGDITYQSDETYTQEAFNSFVQDFGIEIDKDSISLSPREKNLQRLTYSEYKFRKSMKSEKIDNKNSENLSSWF